MVIQGGSGTLRLPVYAHHISHPKGELLFDSGLPQAFEDKNNQRRENRSFRFDGVKNIVTCLEEAHLDPNRIQKVVTSHFHFDHAGGNSLLKNATVIVQEKELEATRIPEFVEKSGYNTMDLVPEHNYQVINGEFDIFNDGSLVCLPTHGHTAGHQSLQILTGKEKMVLASDACQIKQILNDEFLQAPSFDQELQLESLKKLQKLQALGFVIVPGHEPLGN